MRRRDKLAEVPGVERLWASEDTSWSGFAIGKHKCHPHAPISRFGFERPHVLLITESNPRAKWWARGCFHSSQWRPGTTILVDQGYEMRELEFESARVGLRVCLDPGQAAAWFQQDLRRMSEPHVVTEDPQIKLMIKCMFHEIDDGCPSGDLFAETISLALFAHTWSRYADGARGSRLSNGLSVSKLHVIGEYVEEHLSSNIKLADLANLVDLSPRHLCRSFKEAMGVTPYRYVLQKRIARAKLHLTAGKLSVTEIAFLLGFSSHSHFSNYFRKEVGVSPREFMQR